MSKLSLVTGRSGSGKTEYCLTQISELLEENPQGSPLILIVPEQATFQMEKALANKLTGQGFLGAQIFGFRRFSHRILQETGGIWLPSLSDSGRQLILGRILRNRKDDLLALGKAALRTRFADTLSELIQEFRTHRIKPEQLRSTAESLIESPLKNKLLDLSLLYQDFMDFLENRYRDGNEALDRTALAISDCQWLKGARIWIDGFDRFTPQEWEIIRSLLATSEDVTLALCMDRSQDLFSENNLFYRPGQTYRKALQMAEELETSVQEIPLDSFRRSKESDLIHLENFLFSDTLPFAEQPEHIRLIAAPNPRQEVIAIARQMINHVRLQGYRWQDMALLFRQEEIYTDIVESVFREYDIPFYQDQNVAPLHHPVVELLRSTFDIISSRWLPEPIFRAAKTGLLKIEEDHVDQLENYVLEFGLKDKSRWAQKDPWQYVRHYALEEDFDLNEAALARLDLIEKSRVTLAAPLLQLEDNWKKSKTVREQATALYSFWETLGLDDQLEAMALKSENENDPETARLHRQMGAEIRGLLDELVDLLGDESLGLSEFAQLINDGLEGLSIRLIPPGLDHVTIHSLQSVLPSHIRIAFLPGANDGLFPARCRPDGLLSEADRLLLMKESGLELSPSGLSEAYNERLIAYRGLVAPTDKLWLSYASATKEGATLTPSSLVARLQLLFPNLKLQTIRPDDDWEKNEPTQSLFRTDSGLISLAGALRRFRDEDRVLPHWREVYNHFLAQEDWQPKLNDIVTSLLENNTAKNLPVDLAQQLYAPKHKLKGSVTRLEAYQSCPFKHFAQYGLKLKKRPEFRLSPPQVGVLLHGVLKKYGQSLLDQKKKWHQISGTEQSELTQNIINELASKLQNEILYSNAQYQYFLKRLTQTVEKSIGHLTAFSALTAFEPLALEQSFGDNKEGWQPLRFNLQGGISLEISGQIDRIDGVRTEDQTYLLVIDYKSGNQKLVLEKVYHGLSLQLLTYLLAALEGMEALTESPHPHGAGILYYTLKNPLLTEKEPCTPEEIQEKMTDALRMPGWLLKDKAILNLMETSFDEEKETVFLPKVKLTAKEDFHSGFARNLRTSEDFSDLLQHLESLLTSSGEKILTGDVQITPYQLHKQVPCTFCDYRSFCGFDRFQGNHYRELESLKDSEIFQKLKKEGDSNE